MPHKSKTQLSNSLYNDFKKLSIAWSIEVDSEDFAAKLDEEDPLKDFRKRFHYPKKKHLDEDNLSDENEETIYFCGQSLGLQLKSINSCLKDVLQDWAQRGVECHFRGHLPAASCDTPLKEKMAYLVGAQPEEVTLMNGLTVNIHLLLGSFYKPTMERHKILMVGSGFHSDLYAVQSHIAFRGYNPKDSIIFLNPRTKEDLIHPKDIKKVIEREGGSISVIFLEGVHYYTGQLFDMKDITRAGHEQGCIVGFDLAHAVGNVNLRLHEWNVDFAMWCTYKYLNSGPGSMGAAFVHNRHTQASDPLLPVMQGWWGLSDKRKFAFDKEFTPAEGTDRFKLSNPSPFLSSMVLANLEVFKEAGLDRLREKQRFLTGYLDYLLRLHFPQCDGMDPDKPHIRIITPSNPNKRGSQISLISSVPISMLDTLLKAKGVVCDIRKPSVIRVTPVPLYNTFSEVYQFVHILKEMWDSMPCNESPEK